MEKMENGVRLFGGWTGFQGIKIQHENGWAMSVFSDMGGHVTLFYFSCLPDLFVINGPGVFTSSRSDVPALASSEYAAHPFLS
jgi:hypothetical protein